MTAKSAARRKLVAAIPTKSLNQAESPNQFDLHSYFSGFTIGKRSEIPGQVKKRPGDFGDIYKVPAQGNPRGGRPFEMRRPGRKVKELTLWSAPNLLRGLQVTFEDGAVMKAGRLSGKGSRSISFHPDESITSTTISSTKFDRGRAGSLQLKTDFGQDYLGVFPSMPGLNQFTFFTDVKRGTLIGAYGSAADDIDSLGIILALPEDTEYQYFNVRYDLSAFKAVGGQPISLKEGIADNSKSDASVDIALTFSHTYTATKTWSNSVGLKAGVKTTIKTGVPFIVEGKVELSFEASYTYNWGETIADQKTDAWTATVRVPPRSKVRVLATVTESTIDVPYTAELMVTRSDGSSRTIKQFSGVYRGVNVSRFMVTAESIPQAKRTAER